MATTDGGDAAEIAERMARQYADALKALIEERGWRATVEAYIGREVRHYARFCAANALVVASYELTNMTLGLVTYDNREIATVHGPAPHYDVLTIDFGTNGLAFYTLD